MLQMQGPQTLRDYAYLRSTKGLSVGYLGYLGHPQQEAVIIEGFMGLLDVWGYRNILNIGSQRNLGFKGSGSGLCGYMRSVGINMRYLGDRL